MEALFEQITKNQELVTGVVLSLLIFIRMVFAIFFTPFFGGKNLPARIKMGCAMALTLFIYPAIAASLPGPVPLAAPTVMLLFVKEIFVGLTMALLISMVFYGIQSAGQFIDNQRGISTASLFNPALGAQVSLSGNFLFQLSVVIFFIIGGHQVYISGFFRSFEILPVIYYPNVQSTFMDPTLQTVVKLSGQVLAIAIQIAAPVIISLFLSEMVLGIANRVAPQMDVLFISYTLKAIVGLVIVFFALHLMVHQMEILFKGHLEDIAQVVNALPRY